MIFNVPSGTSYKDMESGFHLLAKAFKAAYKIAAPVVADTLTSMMNGAVRGAKGYALQTYAVVEDRLERRAEAKAELGFTTWKDGKEIRHLPATPRFLGDCSLLCRSDEELFSSSARHRSPEIQILSVRRKSEIEAAGGMIS